MTSQRKAAVELMKYQTQIELRTLRDRPGNDRVKYAIRRTALLHILELCNKELNS